MIPNSDHTKVAVAMMINSITYLYQPPSLSVVMHNILYANRAGCNSTSCC